MKPVTIINTRGIDTAGPYTGATPAGAQKPATGGAVLGGDDPVPVAALDLAGARRCGHREADRVLAIARIRSGRLSPCAHARDGDLHRCIVPRSDAAGRGC